VTFSLVVRDPATNTFAMAISSSSPAVAARCVHLRHGLGGAASQNITNPVLGEDLLDCLAGGLDAADAMAQVVSAEPTINYRQLTVVDNYGHSAVYCGAQTLGTFHTRRGDNVAAAGNMLASTKVIDALYEGYVESREGQIEARLLDGLFAALDAGGEAGPLHSAGLVVTGGAGWHRTDLRVDWSDDPIEDLAELWELWAPQRDDYLTRGLDPASAPSYGVPGDE